MGKNISKKYRKHGQILGVKIASNKPSQLLDEITKKLTFEPDSNKFFITTPNPEIVLKASEDSELKSILNKSDFSVPDGVGLKIYGDLALEIYPGRKLMLDVCKICEANSLKVFVLGGTPESNEDARLKLNSLYPELEIQGYSGARYTNTANPVSEVDLKSHFDTVKMINKFRPAVIFVALGCPKQEYWIDKYLPLLRAKSAMTVGGAIDYLSGKASLPPKIFESLGLEWLWRLFSEPERAGRIFSAFVVFPWQIFISKLKTGK